MRKLILLFVFATLPLAAHDELDDQIHNVTHRLEGQPRNAELYLQRGELYRLAEEWEQAERDYRHALQLDPALDAVHLGRGLMLYESMRPDRAIAELQQYLAGHPDDSLGRVTLARCHAKLGQADAAAAEYDAALVFLPWLDPDVIVERARALAAAGRIAEGLHTLEEGMERLGPIATFQLTAIDLELEFCNPEGALQRIASAEAAAPRKETWLTRRGDILKEMNRPDEARAAYRQALEALTTLPEPRRRTRAIRDLEARLREAVGQ